MLIDVSYFLAGPRHIANASMGKLPSQDSIAVNDTIMEYVKEYQPLFLSSMLGYKLSKEVADYLELLENEVADADKDAGVEAVMNDMVVEESKYELLCTQLRESFANYVFFHILRDANTQATIKGLVLLKCDNTYIAPIQRQVSIWNDMVKKNKKFVKWASSLECPFNVSIESNMLTPINAFNL
ncbi:hypothetical protein [Bacteroides sp.]|uniref:hypothetical protein n=1 Tax=Bacteroides sp. TaxID=29523 RepID=UPI00261247C3|nr:hypothetical protein [Bacteroides sp.]